MVTREEAVKAALTALGDYYRADWSEFDGRTLRAELNEIIRFFSVDDYVARASEFLAGLDESSEARGW